MAPYGYSTASATTNAWYSNTTGAVGTLTYSTYWYGGSTSGAIYVQSAYSIHVQPVVEESEEEKRTRLERERLYQQERAERQTKAEDAFKRAEAANKRAEELLKQHIGLEAFGKLHQVGYIELDSQKYSGRKYRVKSGAREYIEILDESGKVVDWLCIHPTVRCPDGDEILTKILLIESAEELLLATANHRRA